MTRSANGPVKRPVFSLLRALVSGCLGVLLMAHIQAQEAQPSLTFGIVPQQSASRLAEEWGPLLSELSRRSGVLLVFRTAPSIPVFEERLAKGAYDLAYMNPYGNADLFDDFANLHGGPNVVGR